VATETVLTAGRHGHAIRRSVMRGMQPGRMIGDEIVNRWDKLLQERSDTLADADKDGAQLYPSVAIMQSTLFEKIARPVGGSRPREIRSAVKCSNQHDCMTVRPARPPVTDPLWSVASAQELY
jgi:hypothetical protein